MVQMIPTATRAVASVAPRVIEKSKELAPQAYNYASNWIAGKMGVQNPNLTQVASSPKGATAVLGALMEGGLTFEHVSDIIPVTSREAMKKYMAQVAQAQLSIRERGDSTAGGVTPKEASLSSAMVMSLVRTNVSRAARALGAHTINDLRVRLDAIRAIDNDDLAAVEFESGPLVSNIQVMP